MPTELHQQRMDAVMQRLLNRRSRTVLDLGCGRGQLLTRLADDNWFNKIIAVDISTDALKDARDHLGSRLTQEGNRIALLHGSFAEENLCLTGFDAAVLLETIEHIEPDRLSRVESAVFGCYRPRVVLITTPNREYNVLYNKREGQIRHPDHRFEWTREKFEGWAIGVADRNGYNVDFAGIGSPHPVFGGPTQMAEFSLSTTPGG